MQNTPLFKPTKDGQAYDIAPAGVLLVLADTVYGDGRQGSTPAGIARADRMINAMLSAARAGGFTQCDILHTLIVRGERSERVEDMARAACTAAGNDRIGAIFAAIRNGGAS